MTTFNVIIVITCNFLSLAVMNIIKVSHQTGKYRNSQDTSFKDHFVTSLIQGIILAFTPPINIPHLVVSYGNMLVSKQGCHYNQSTV